MRWAIFDTETTALIKNLELPLEKLPRVIEFFGQIVDDETGQIVDELEFMCNPGIPLTEEITRITGITPAMLEGKPRFADFAPRVLAFFLGAEGMVAHNLSYDRDIVAIEMRRLGLSDKLMWPSQQLCTVEETEWIKGHRMSLSMLHEYLFGAAFEGAHRARVDVDALTRCFLELRKREML